MSISENIESINSVNIQQYIEQLMEKYYSEERWESIYMFSPEGLKIAGFGSTSSYSEDILLEFAFTLINGAKLLGENLAVKEIILRDANRKQLIFHFVKSVQEEFIVAAVSQGKKGFRRAIAKLEKQILSLYD